jgi:crossover junction endodeoxyribonuclease RusA
MLSFRLDYPPTVNLYWRVWNGRPVLSAKGRAYRSAAEEFRPPTPLDTRLAVRLRLTMPDRRKRDIDNVAKAVLDAIGHAGIWHDDSQVDRLLIERIAIEPPGCVDVIIEEI